MNLKGIICINAKMPWRLSENLGKSQVVKIDASETSNFFSSYTRCLKITKCLILQHYKSNLAILEK